LAEGSIYKKWSITVEGLDIMTSQIVTKTSTIVDHTFSEGRHIVTLDPDLGVEFEMGSSKATLRCSSAPCATRVAYLRRRAARILTGHRD
jgi:hypothetical protein